MKPPTLRVYAKDESQSKLECPKARETLKSVARSSVLKFLMIFFASIKACMAFAEGDSPISTIAVPDTPSSKKKIAVGFREGVLTGFGTSQGVEIAASNEHFQYGATYYFPLIAVSDPSRENRGPFFEISPVRTVTKHTYDLSLGFFRYIIGNSFSIMAGIGYQIWHLEIDAKELSTDETARFYDWGYGLATIFAIGNIWRYDNGFFIGCDWIGGKTTLYTQHNSAIKISDNFPKSSSKELGETFKSYKAENDFEVVPILLLVNIGWAW
jgi:hypothetical protein